MTSLLPRLGLGFGGAAIGNLYRPVDDAAAREAVDAAWTGGVRYFDTAPHYGLGLSERRLGEALSMRPRSDFVVSTKVGRLLEPNPTPSGSDLAVGGFAVPDSLMRRRDYSADGVRHSIDESLERTGLDRFDIVLVHDPDEHLDQALDEAIPALAALREDGVIGAIGLGMNHPAPLQRAVRDSDVDLVMVAGRWTLLDRTAEALLQACLARGVGVLAAAPFNSGLLAAPRPRSDATFDYGRAPVDLIGAANRLAEICEAHGVSLPAAALQFPLRHRAVVAVVAGMQTGAESSSATQRFAEPLPEALWAELDEARLLFWTAPADG